MDRTPKFIQHRTAYWHLSADKIPMTADGFRQVRASMTARMDLIRAQEKESRALLAAAQYNVSNALQLQCSAAEELELLRRESDLMQRIIDQLLPDSPTSPPDPPSSPPPAPPA